MVAIFAIILKHPKYVKDEYRHIYCTIATISWLSILSDNVLDDIYCIILIIGMIQKGWQARINSMVAIFTTVLKYPKYVKK